MKLEVRKQSTFKVYKSSPFPLQFGSQFRKEKRAKIFGPFVHKMNHFGINLCEIQLLLFSKKLPNGLLFKGTKVNHSF
jgi:hypothetical protein